jgi:hypothetical protein
MTSKNFILVAPIFPYTFYQFAIGLKKHGFRVLVIGDISEAYLPSQLVANMDGYYYVHDMNHYPNLKAAVAFFVAKFGPIDYLESNIEHWLRYDAQLREDFDIPHGLRPDLLAQYQSKAGMKAFYQKANIPCARYTLATSKESVIAFASEVGYPLFVKPDKGVGSQVSYKIKNAEALEKFFATKPDQMFIVEEFIDGEIYSFDGMSNDQGDVVFYTAHQFPINIADIVNDDAETYYVTLKDIPEELIQKGKAAVKAFGLNQRFFHLEFFRLRHDVPHLGKQGSFVALEANLRPCGGFTMEMMNYANSVNTYQIYADVIATNQWNKTENFPTYYCAIASRKNHHQYQHDFVTIRSTYGDAIVFEHSFPYPISIAMGDYFFMAKLPTMDAVNQFFQFVLAK